MASIVSFNCNSVKKSIEKVKALTESFDIILLQELMLLECDAGYLDKINKDFISFSHLKDRTINNVNIGRPINGVAFLVNNALKNVVSPIYISERFIGLIINASNCKYLLLNVYLPVDRQTHESFHNFKNEISLLGAAMHELDINNIVVAGDFNASDKKHLLWDEILHFCRDFSLDILDFKLPSNSFTYLSPSCNSTTWIDHVLCSKHLSDKVLDLEILYGFSLYDHFPIAFNLDIHFFQPYRFMHSNKSYDINSFVKWDSLKSSDLKQYQSTLQRNINSFPFHIYETFNCYKSNCNELAHKTEIESLFKFLINSINSASNKIRINKTKKFNIVPGWNSIVKESHELARKHLISWIEEGRIKSGPSYENMLSSRANFRQRLRHCKANELNIRKAEFTQSLSEKNAKKFWKLVRNNKNSDNKSVSRIDNETDQNCIAQLFANKFKKVFDDKACQSSKKFEYIAHSEKSLRYFNTSLVSNAIKELNPTLDHYNIHANHLKFSPIELTSFLSKFFSICYRHSFLPGDMVNGVLSPLIKDRFGDHESSNNYRPIISSSIFLKIFEYAIKMKIEHLLTTDERQFGFKRESSTQLAGLTLKEVAHKYLQQGSSVFAGFLDISKAFDKVSHKILFETLH